MTTRYFNVKQGLTTGNILLDASSGNITTTNANLGNLVTSNYFSGSGNLLSNIQAANVSGTVGAATTAGTVTTNAQPNITSVGTLSGLTATGTLDFTTASNVALGAVGNVHITGGTSGYVLSTDGSGTLSWVSPSSTGIAGSNTQVQFNDGGSFGADANFTYNKTTDTLGIKNITVEGAGSISGGNLVSANYITGTLTTAAQPNITSVGTLADLNVTGNGVIGGNLAVNGTLTYINVTTFDVKDPIIELGGGTNGAPLTSDDGKDRGTLLHYYTTTTVDAFMGWDNSNAEFGFGSNVTLSSEVVTWNQYGNIRAGYFIGNGSQLTGVTAVSATTAGTVTTNAQPNITSLGSLSGLTVSNATGVVNFTTTANVTLGAVGNLHISGGSSGYYLQTDGSGGLSWAAVPTGAGISNGTSNINAGTVNGNITVSIGGTANVVVWATTGEYITGLLSVSGNVSSGNANLGNLVTANYFSGSGNLLSNIQGANVSGTVSSATSATSATTAGTVTTAAQPNITSVGTLSSVSVTGNATVGNVIVSGGILSNRANVSVSTNTVVDQFSPSSFRTAKYVISASGDNGYQSVETLLVHDGVNSYVTIYGSICSNTTADIIDLSSNINGISGNVSLYATASGANTLVNVVATYLKT